MSQEFFDANGEVYINDDDHRLCAETPCLSLHTIHYQLLSLVVNTIVACSQFVIYPIEFWVTFHPVYVRSEWCFPRHQSRLFFWPSGVPRY
jgi:hypothetical protein